MTSGVNLHFICQQSSNPPNFSLCTGTLSSVSSSDFFLAQTCHFSPVPSWTLSPPMTGTERFSARDTTLGRSQGSRTIGSKKVEWGAATRTGASRREALWPRTRIRRKPSRKNSRRLRPRTPLWHTVLPGQGWGSVEEGVLTP